MRDFASSCFGNHAIKVSDGSGSGTGSSSGSNSSVVADGAGSALSAVSCLYRARLSALKDVLLRVTWSRANAAPLLSLAVDDHPRSALPWMINASDSQPMTEKRGTRSYLSGHCDICLHWDISAARYESGGPEPVGGFYVVVVVESELALLLGDLSRDFASKLEGALPLAQCSTICRREQVLGHAHHSTRARFCDGGSDHEITIRCKDPELSVSVDKKLVVLVRSLRWNFRGNQTIFIDGSPVDMMWDVHDWWFTDSCGYAVFMFRTRSALESRLWLEEEALNAEQQGTPGFSLVIQASRRP